MDLRNQLGYSLRQLTYFVAIAETGTISAAAQRLHASQSAVSLAVNELERALGTQLCVRRKAHGVVLTPTGAEVLRQARTVLQHAEELQAVASGRGAELSGPLAIGCYLTLAPTVLPWLLAGFGDRHPGVRVDFAEGTQDTLQQRLLAGELDLAVLYDMEILPEIDSAALYTTRPHILLPADHPCAEQPEVSLRELASHPMVLLESPPSTQHTMKVCRAAGMAPTVRHRTTSFETARALVGRGLGYSVLVQRPSNERTYEGFRVVCKEIAEHVGEVAVLLAWPRHSRLSARAGAFIDYATDPAGSPAVACPR
ncbi:LysR substrate-binding domain-containing protein [Haloactinomyces albus]|uniref:DNA-binding transcriptional LysR family regulator n=1 Tax=Haloactinomyces albus TaxID=1352928 RepID=A0AAE4CNM4_9ACTN|nr:LysR substrate-binding domain-containing protein [Haloactinomyces albus]MDR7303626.1 DNA-binding transcriptional LysR family regulator [Haloactinomyces albus]